MSCDYCNAVLERAATSCDECGAKVKRDFHAPSPRPLPQLVLPGVRQAQPQLVVSSRMPIVRSFAGYEHGWGLVILFVFFWPAGLYVLWRRRKIKRGIM
jgi:hypothetical protein